MTSELTPGLINLIRDWKSKHIADTTIIQSLKVSKEQIRQACQASMVRTHASGINKPLFIEPHYKRDDNE